MPYIQKDLESKIILLSGPRQCGKTTLSKQLTENYDYYNYDALNDREALWEQSWDRSKSLIIFDELHKMKNWKRWLKGIYDTEKIPPALLVTGSAKLNTFRKVGDSLAGRYFQFQLHPLDLKEIVGLYSDDREKMFDQLWHCSGFPEPFFKGSQTFYKRWQMTHVDSIIRQDLIDLYTLHDINSVQNLILLLRNCVGSSVSYASLARDLQKDISTIKRWLIMLEELYIIYRVTPYSKRISRALLKEPKFYFYDHNQVKSEGARLENLVANALLKELDFLQNTLGDQGSLHYLRTKDGQEMDFLVCINDQPTHMIEVKSSDDAPVKAFNYFAKFITDVQKIQLVKTLHRPKSYPNGLEIKALVPWLAYMDLTPSQATTAAPDQYAWQI